MQYRQTNARLSIQAAQAVHAAANAYNNVIVNAWQMSPGEESVLQTGDTLVLINSTADGDEPHGRSTAFPPARIVELVPGRGRSDAAAVYAYDARLSTTTYARVRDAVDIDWSWSAPITDAAAITSILARYGL